MCTGSEARGPGRMFFVELVAVLLMLSGMTEVNALTLAEAEAIAQRADPGVQAVASRRQAIEELAVANRQLPDPMLRGGILSLPTNTWNLGQEPMTQAVIGVTQKFPRGHSRALSSEQMLERAEALGEAITDQRLRIALAVREEFLEVLKQEKLAEINAEAIEAFSDLADITQDYYATGRVQQQDVLRAAVELARVQDRATRIRQDQDQARARLETWIGSAAYGQLTGDWPEFADAPTLDAIRKGLQQHPRIEGLQKQVDAADTGVELADQRYRPEFSVDLAYGGRSGTNPDGSARSDLFSFMLVMDLPIFTSNRQDRYKAAAASDSAAAAFERDDVYRRMNSEAAMQAATLGRQLERIRIFEDSLLPDAEFNADAAYSAYQAALESLTTLMRARITEFDLQLEYISLRAESLKTRARLLYLQGETS